MGIVIGFDFGTCFSSVYFINGGEYVGLYPENETAKNLIPTVYYKKGSKESFGLQAIRHGKSAPDCLVRYVKRKYKEDVIPLRNEITTPETVVEKIVGYIIKGAIESLRNQYHLEKEEISVILTIPVTYGEEWKHMLENAFLRINVEVKAIINEPVAAALYFMENNFQADRNILVYDLGGGTTDITLLRSSSDMNRLYEEIAHDGEDIGGNDWDERVCNEISEQIFGQLIDEGIDDEECERLIEKNYEAILEAARTLKESLTERESDSFDVTINGDYYTVEFTRQQLETVTRSLLDRTINAVRRTVAGNANPDEIILVGGGSRMKQVMERMKQEFPDCPVNIRNPEFAVAMGAAKYAELLEKKKAVLLKSTHSYGIVCTDNGRRVIHNLIFRNEDIPVSNKCELHSDSIATQFDIYESEISDTSITEIPLSEGRYAVSASIWLNNSSGNRKYFTALELGQDGILKLRIIDENENVIAEAEMQSNQR